MKEVAYPAVMTQVNGHVRVDFPDLPDAFAKGDDVAQAIANAKLSLALVIIDMQTHFEEVPTASDLKTISAKNPEADVQEIKVNLDDY